MKTCIIKLSGKISDDSTLLAQLAQGTKALLAAGICPVIVHGGGKQLTQLTERLGIVTQIVKGRRITCQDTLAAAQMAFLGLVQPRIVGALGRCGVVAVGLSGADGGTVIAIKRAVTSVDYGFVGDIIAVQTRLLDTLCAAGHVPVVGPLAVAPDGTLLNVNADTVAAELGLALKATTVVMVSDTPGVMADRAVPESVLSRLTLSEAEAMSVNGQAVDGMLPKLAAVSRALKGGIPMVRVVGPEALERLHEVVTGGVGIGTVITRKVVEAVS